MKKGLSILGGVLICAAVYAQQTSSIIFQNDSFSLISNAFTGMLVKSNDYIRAMLYYGPDGSTNEDAYIALPPDALVGAPPGRYNGGSRVITSPNPISAVMIQVRAWEMFYGSTYEDAVAAPAANGRKALAGKSRIARAILGSNSPTNGASSRIVGPFAVDIVGGGASLRVGDLIIAEGSNGVVQANFKISLSSAQPEVVSVDYATQDGSALAGQDYVATSGTVVFAAGETLKTVPVTVTADAPPEPDEYFFMSLSNPVNGFIVRPQGTCTITEIRISNVSVDTSISFNTLANKRYRVEKSSDLVNWSDIQGATNVLGTGNIVTVLDRGVGCEPMVVYRASLLDE